MEYNLINKEDRKLDFERLRKEARKTEVDLEKRNRKDKKNQNLQNKMVENENEWRRIHVDDN